MKSFKNRLLIWYNLVDKLDFQQSYLISSIYLSFFSIEKLPWNSKCPSVWIYRVRKTLISRLIYQKEDLFSFVIVLLIYGHLFYKSFVRWSIGQFTKDTNVCITYVETWMSWLLSLTEVWFYSNLLSLSLLVQKTEIYIYDIWSDNMLYLHITHLYSFATYWCCYPC